MRVGDRRTQFVTTVRRGPAVRRGVSQVRRLLGRGHLGRAEHRSTEHGRGTRHRGPSNLLRGVSPWLVAVMLITLPVACKQSTAVSANGDQESAGPGAAAPAASREASKAQTGTAAPRTAASAEESFPPPGPTSWASFRNGPRQLGVAGSTLPDSLELLWKFPVEYGVVTSAAIVGGHVYVGAMSGDFYCLAKSTGDVVWQYRSTEEDDDNAAPGFKAPPTVTVDAVYVGDDFGGVHAIERATGKKRWTLQTDAEIAGGAAVVGENVIVGSHDSNLYCLSAADGSVVWKFPTLDRINCSPAVAENFTFVAGCDEHLRVINLETAEQKSDIPLGSYLIASPAVLGDMLYVGTYTSEVVAINWKSEEIVWKYSDPTREQPYHASAAVTDKHVIAGGRDKQLHCIDRATGEGVWKFPTRAKIDSSPVIVGNRVFFGSSDRNVYGVNIETGEEAWKFNTGGDVTAAPAVGENVLVIGTEGNPAFVFCFGEK